MSVKIDNMSTNTFTTTPTGITKPITNNTGSASTTAFVKTFFSSTIQLIDTVSIMATLTFTTIYASVVRGVSALTLRGNLSIGGASTTVKLLNNTLNLDADYPYLLSSYSGRGQKIQAGYITLTSTAFTVITPIASTLPTIAIVSATANTTCSVLSTPTSSGFPIKTATAITEAHWISFST